MDKKEYIERTAAIKYLQSRKAHFEDDIGKGWDAGLDAAIEAVENLPDADVVEVRHAKWKYFHKQNKAVCTNCSFERDLDADFGRAVACPNCGARMDEGYKYEIP